MRARKPSAVVPEDLPPPDDVAEAWPSEEAPEASFAAGPSEAGPIARLCVACGSDDCHEHHETARLDAPSRAVHDAVSRLRRAALEHRAAARALRALVVAEVARGRGGSSPLPCPG